MCISVFMWDAHPIYPFILLLNRDEYHNRVTRPLGWWPEEEEEDGLQILGGKDEEAGGTWLAATRNGRIAFLTNYRESSKLSFPTSRGQLPLLFLKSNQSPQEFANKLVEDREADKFNGFNLIVADICSMSMMYISNRSVNHDETPHAIPVSPGIHVLSNANLDTPWPKAVRLEQSFRGVLLKYGNVELPIKEVVGEIMTDTTKDEDYSKLPGIYPLEFEHKLSAIFVDVKTPTGMYGTRSTSALTVKGTGEASFYEKYITNGEWKEQEVNYRIKREKKE